MNIFTVILLTNHLKCIIFYDFRCYFLDENLVANYRLVISNMCFNFQRSFMKYHIPLNENMRKIKTVKKEILIMDFRNEWRINPISFWSFQCIAWAQWGNKINIQTCVIKTIKILIVCKYWQRQHTENHKWTFVLLLSIVIEKASRSIIE